MPHEELIAALDYDRETGLWRWRYRPDRDQSWNTRYANTEAGVLRPDGYRYIRLNGERCLGSRLAWFFVTGEWPSGEIDHANGNPSDDRWQNLRQATRTQQCGNSRRSRRNASGLKGVWFHKQKGRFTAQCDHKHLGLFDTAEQAHAAYLAAARVKFGEFARGG